MVIFAKGVWLRTSLPYQFIARTEACPPSQLQLLIWVSEVKYTPEFKIADLLYVCITRLLKVGVRSLRIHTVILCARTQISSLSLEFARAPNWGSHVLASCISSLCKLTLNRIYKYGRQKRTSPVLTKRLNGASEHSWYCTSAPILFWISAWWRKST